MEEIRFRRSFKDQDEVILKVKNFYISTLLTSVNSRNVFVAKYKDFIFLNVVVKCKTEFLSLYL